MSTFQKIAVGLLGLTNPEMFIPKFRQTLQSAPKIGPSRDRGSTEAVGAPVRQGAHALRALRFLVAALAIGSRTVPLADNSELSRELGARAGRLYGTNED